MLRKNSPLRGRLDPGEIMGEPSEEWIRYTRFDIR